MIRDLTGIPDCGYVVNYDDTHEQLAKLTRWVNDGLPFYHTRINDGEVSSMFQMFSPRRTASEEHHFVKDMGVALMEAFDGLCRTCRAERSVREKILVGSWWYIWHDFKIANTLRYWLEQNKLIDVVPWAASDVWYSSELEVAGKTAGEELLRLFDAIRMSNRQVILVGSDIIAKCAPCLGAVHIQVPRAECWDARHALMPKFNSWAQSGALFVWCCGIPAKIWSWNLWREFPGSSHLDLGHVFNGACYDHNRAWLKRRDGAHWQFLIERLVPYIDKHTGTV